MEAGEATRCGLRYRFRALQEYWRLLRRGRGNRGGGTHQRQEADAGDRCRRGHQSRRRDQPDRGRRDPGDKLGFEGARPLRPATHHQHHLVGLSDPALQRSAGGGGRADPAAGIRSGRRRRGRAWPGDRGDCERRVRLAWRTGVQPADHARQPVRSNGTERGSRRNILSGGAAQGLIGSLAPAFRSQTGCDMAGELGAVGLMADKSRSGTPADLVILTAALVGRLAEERLVVPSSVSDVGLVETALAVRTDDPKVVVTDAASLRESLRGSDAIFVPDTKASTAGIHVAKVLERVGIADEVASRLKIFANGATAMKHLAASDAKRPIGCTQATEIISTAGVALSGSLPSGYGLSTMYTVGVTTNSPNSTQAKILIDLLAADDQRIWRLGAGFLDAQT